MPTDFSRAAASYAAAAVLAREVGQRMSERLDFVQIKPRRFVDIGCATGDGLRELQRRYPAAHAFAIDSARPMLMQARHHTPQILAINADARRLPVRAAAFDLAWSNLMLHWLDDPRPAFAEVERSLAVEGLFMFAMLGPDTLKELRRAGLASLRRFYDMHDIGDMLLECGFADPVMDMETITLTYATPRGLLRDQRHLGVGAALFGAAGFRPLRAALRRWQAVEGRWPARFEIIYGHAWKAAPRVDAEGRAVIRFRP